MAILRAGAKVAPQAALGLSVLCSITVTILTGLPAYAGGDQNQAIQKYNAKDYQGALNEFKQVCAKDPKNSLSRYYMALCNQCLARVDEAKKDYKWVVDNGAPNLKAQAQAGLSQLEKVTVRTGGSGAMPSTPAATPAASDGAKSGNDLVERSKETAAKDNADKSKGGKGTTASGGKGGKTASATGNVEKVINFYSDSARDSQIMEPAWDEIKGKYPKVTFQKVNAGDPLCEKYSVTQFPTIVVLDKNGKALDTKSGPQSSESMASSIDNCNDKK